MTDASGPVAIPRWAKIAGIILIVLPSICLGQDNAIIELQNRYDSLQQRISELESSSGRYDPALVENLMLYADSAASLNQYDEASTILDRAIQIQRFNLGLHTPEQIPLYLELVESDIRGGNWATANSSLDYLYWLLLEKKSGSEETIVNDLIRLGEFHLRGVVGDDEQNQADHYRKAEELTYIALEISELVWGPTDPRRIDLSYSLIKQFYLQSSSIERGGDTGYELRAIVPDSNWVKPARVVQPRYYRAGLRILDDIQETHVNSSENPSEFLAMLELYRADWHVLFNAQQAETAYRSAYSSLVEAGLETSAVERFFARPQVLPVPLFHSSLTRALTEAESRYAAEQASHDGSVDYYFADWFDLMPYVSFPATAPALSRPPSREDTEFRLRFRLNSLNKVSRWVKGTNLTHISVMEEIEVLDDQTNIPVDTQFLNQRLHHLHFRPHLLDGTPHPFEGTLLYIASDYESD